MVILLYSMDTFIVDALNKATMEQDESKIQNLGPLAITLRSILYGAKDNRGSEGEIIAYRGIVASESTYNDLVNISKIGAKGKMNLHGYTSASVN